MKSLDRAIAEIIKDPVRFARQAGNIILRPYQIPALLAVIDAVRKHQGITIVWIFPRQSGKDETLANLLTYLLTLFQKVGGEIVFFNPTFKPQTETSMRRLDARLSSNILTRKRWKKRSGYIRYIGHAFCTYMSAEPTAKVVSATANLLLICNEAQDIEAGKWDKDADPMSASTNAPKLFCGTRWTKKTLLERELKNAQEAEKADGIKRVFLFTSEDVRKSNPAYGLYVDKQIQKLGRNHPIVKTQLFCETIDDQTNLFPPNRIMLMRGNHPRRETPEPGKTYAFLIDVGGQDEKRLDPNELDNPARDSTFLKIIEINPESIPDLQKPTYRVMNRRQWTGEKHTKVFTHIRALDELWHPQYIIIDATGVGEGLWSMCDALWGDEKVIPFKFSESSKSDLGYAYLAITDTARYKEYSPFDETFLLQLQECESETKIGPSKTLKWGVPETARKPNGNYLHDDDLLASALCAVLDAKEWTTTTEPASYEGYDPFNFSSGF